MPSSSAVPLPNSSISTSERRVAPLSAREIEVASIMKVLCGSVHVSIVATRVKMRSVSPMRARPPHLVRSAAATSLATLLSRRPLAVHEWAVRS